jgi:hypothetical protein
LSSTRQANHPGVHHVGNSAGDAPNRVFERHKVLLGRPFAAAVPCRRYWKHNLKTVRGLGTKRGGVYADGIHFRYQGGQIRSLLSLISYLGSGDYRDRYLGAKIPPTNILDYHLQAARTFADGLANRLMAASGDPKVPGAANSSGGDAGDAR